MRAEFSHEITLPLPIADAFELFTPKGEEAWVPGWAPAYVSPASGQIEEEMLFTTGEGDDFTLWTCLQWQPESWHVRYQRATPASRVAFVDVRCRPVGPDETAVRVAYAYVPLTGLGRAFVAAITDESHAAMIETWAQMIRAHMAVPSSMSVPGLPPHGTGD